jgi:hypothetical protein
MSKTPKRKRNDYEINDKREMVYFQEKNPQMTQKQIKEHFEQKWGKKIGKATVSDILKDKEKYLSTDSIRSPGAKRLREGDYPHLESCLYIWLKDKINNKVCISDVILISQAKVFGALIGISDLEFSYSHGWLDKYKKRFNIKLHTVSGESGGVDMDVVSRGILMLKEEINQYKLDDVFNFDETALFYRLQPNKTLSSGEKISKERLTVGLCVNATGTIKLKPVVIGKYKKPRCFGNVWTPQDIVKYYFNLKAWMTMDIFRNWLQYVDKKMHNEKRNILLLLDNAGGHNTTSDLKLTNVRLLYLPPNTTSMLQPLDAGIIRSFKCHYKEILIQGYLDSLEKLNKIEVPNVKTAIIMITKAWDSVKNTTIRNCWHHCKFLDEHQFNQEVDNEIKTKVAAMNSQLKKLDEFAFSGEEFLTIDDTVNCEELSNEEIVKLVTCVDNEEIQPGDEFDANNIAPPCVSLKEASNALETLLKFFNNRKHNQEETECLDKLVSILKSIYLENQVQSKLPFRRLNFEN